MNKIEQWLNDIITEDGHRMSSGSLRTIEMIRRELAQKQTLQQTPCTTLLELLDQMLKEENEALGKAGFYEQYKRETHANQKYCLAIVKLMIEARLPVA